MKRRNGWDRGVGCTVLCALLALSAACGDDAETDGEGGSGAGTGNGGEDGSGASNPDGGGPEGGGTTTDGGGPSTGGSNGDGGGSEDAPEGQLSVWRTTAPLPDTPAGGELGYSTPLVVGDWVFAFITPGLNDSDVDVARTRAAGDGELEPWDVLDPASVGATGYTIGGAMVAGSRIYLNLYSTGTDRLLIGEVMSDGEVVWAQPVDTAYGWTILQNDGIVFGQTSAQQWSWGRVEADGALTWQGAVDTPDYDRLGPMVVTESGVVAMLGAEETGSVELDDLQVARMADFPTGGAFSPIEDLPVYTPGCTVVDGDVVYMLGTTLDYALFGKITEDGVEGGWTATTRPPVQGACFLLDGHVYSMSVGTNGQIPAGTVFVSEIL